jgi:putative endonuclease
MVATSRQSRRRTGGPVRAALGAFGEELAAQHLTSRGMVLLDRNWRCDLGEIDLVARDGNVLVICEVKTRRGAGFGTPEEAVTRAKAARLRRLAARWLAEHPVSPAALRIDVIGVSLSRGGAAPEVNHLVGVC